MLYFELGLNDEDYLTEKELRRFGTLRKMTWWFKSKFGIIVKKKIENKVVYVIPVVNKIFLKRVNKILKVTGQKQVCISDELFYKKDFLSLLRENKVSICDSSWILKYMLINILDYIYDSTNELFISDEIAFLVNSDYEMVIEYIKLLANRFKVITVVTNNIKYFSKIEEKFLKNDGIDINIVNNYRKTLSKTDIIVNIDFNEKLIKKYTIFNKAIFINLFNKYELAYRKFEGVNITSVQIAMPDKYLGYVELFKNFNYLNSYESLIKKKTSILNILKEIKKDELNIICLENENGVIKKEEFLRDVNKILDK